VAEADLGAQRLEDDGALALVRPVGGVEDHHPRATLDESVGGGEAGDADAGDHDAQPLPVRGRRRQTVEPPRRHWPTTHSA
jgi:hypothetical protein